MDRHDADDCDEIPLLKHSPFYSISSLFRREAGIAHSHAYRNN